MSIVIQTLGDLKRHGYAMWGHCGGPHCGYGKRIDLDLLIARYGENYVFIGETDIGARLKCPRCGYRGGSTTISPPTRPLA